MAARNAKSHDPRTDWPGIAVPVFGLFGVRDQSTGPADVRAFARVLPTASVTTLDEAGPFAHIEQPTATFDLGATVGRVGSLNGVGEPQ